MEDFEYQVLKIQAGAQDIQLTNSDCPNHKSPSLDTINTEVSSSITVGDINGHSQSWGYQRWNWKGEVENWQGENRLLLINSPSDQLKFYSRWWHTTSTPDTALCTQDLHGSIRSEVGEQLEVTRPLACFWSWILESAQKLPLNGGTTRGPTGLSGPKEGKQLSTS